MILLASRTRPQFPVRLEALESGRSSELISAIFSDRCPTLNRHGLLQSGRFSRTVETGLSPNRWIYSEDTYHASETLD
jgi:hypothetical protein